MGDPSMNYWLGVKYGVQGQNAAAAQTGANAAMVGAQGNYLRNVGERGMLDKQAGTWDADAAAKRALESGQGALYGAQAGAIPGMTAAQIAHLHAQSNLFGAQAAAIPGMTAAQIGEMNARAAQGQAQAAAIPGMTGAQIGEMGSRSNLYNSESDLNTMRGNPDTLDWLSRGYNRSVLPGYSSPFGQHFAAGTENVQPHDAPATPEALAAHWDHINGYACGTANVQHLAAGTANVPPPGQPRDRPKFNAVAAPMGNWFLDKVDQSLGNKPAAQPQGQPQHYDQGTQRVPGKGSGMVDKVKAVLAPGEAVLNKGAAEHMGRDNIAALNAIGHAKMVGEAAQGAAAATPGREPQKGPAHKAPEKPAGKGPAKPAPKVPEKGAKAAGGHGAKAAPAGKGKPQELAKGTHHVAPGKSAKTPQIDPQTLQALMSMMSQGGGGGMPGPGGGGAPPPGGGMV